MVLIHRSILQCFIFHNFVAVYSEMRTDAGEASMSAVLKLPEEAGVLRNLPIKRHRRFQGGYSWLRTNRFLQSLWGKRSGESQMIPNKEIAHLSTEHKTADYEKPLPKTETENDKDQSDGHTSIAKLIQNIVGAPKTLSHRQATNASDRVQTTPIGVL